MRKIFFTHFAPVMMTIQICEYKNNLLKRNLCYSQIFVFSFLALEQEVRENHDTIIENQSAKHKNWLLSHLRWKILNKISLLDQNLALLETTFVEI
ncbi:MAG: hypothetical protein GY820_25785 [Gammaproteobacteria bacterium]|nr:hypothetical protein [Gammaproteobacteria bacterium]